MKIKNYFALISIAAFAGLGLTFTSCGDDAGDDDATGGKGGCSAKMGSSSFDVPYGFWYLNSELSPSNDESNVVTMEFYSFDPTSAKIPSSMSFVAIEYDLPDGQREISSIVVEGGKYHVYAATGVTMSSEGFQCETKDGDSNNSDLKIVRNGNSYSVSIERATVGDESKNYDFSFSYSGGLSHQVIGE